MAHHARRASATLLLTASRRVRPVCSFCVTSLQTRLRRRSYPTDACQPVGIRINRWGGEYGVNR